MMETMMNLYWDETAANEKFAADIAEVEKTVSRKTGARRSRNQKQKDSIRKGKQRYEAAQYRYQDEDIPVPGKLRFHQLPRDKGSDNFHNVRAEQVAKAELNNYAEVEVEILEPITA